MLDLGGDLVYNVFELNSFIAGGTTSRACVIIGCYERLAAYLLSMVCASACIAVLEANSGRQLGMEDSPQGWASPPASTAVRSR